MDEVRDLLKILFNKDTRYHSKKEIKRLLKLKGEIQEDILDKVLESLVEDGILFFNKKQGYRIFPKQSGFAFGYLEINKAGTGFVHTNDGHTILIENNDLNGALDGDSVIVYSIFNKRKDYYHGKIYEITKRNNGNIIFEVVENNGIVNLVPYNKNECVNVNINKNELKGLMDGELILVNVGCKQEFGIFDATITKVIGYKDDPDIDVRLIFEKHNLPVDFSEEIIKEAEELPKSVSEEEIKDREDLRDEVILTIDCDNTKDRDDAIGIKKLPNGNYLLKVNIAHVSHYIKKESKSFEEALRRTSSHYPLSMCIPMFHHIISNGICSLNEGVDRLTRTVEMEINTDGEIVNYDIYKSVINSKKAMSYSEVNNILNDPKSTFKYKKELDLMREINIILERAKNKRNYINFDVEETHIVQDANNNTTGFTPTNHGESGNIIENFMLVANETVYKHFAWFILAYRVHEVPDQDKVDEIINLLRESGIKVPKLKNVSSASLKNLLNNLDESEVSKIIKSYLLKSQKKARYDTVNIGHFALQYLIYGHFTSPIRRIIDLITHMTIDNIETFDYSEESIKEFEKFLNEVCERANKIEKIDRQINEECMEMEMAHYMEDHVGEEYEVYVTDIGRHSMLVKTTNHIIGKIKIENMTDDKYYYDNDKKAIIGKHNKHKYQIGNHFIALVKDACKETRTINFEIPKQLVKKIS